MIKLSAKTYKKGKDTARREEKKIDLSTTSIGVRHSDKK